MSKVVDNETTEDSSPQSSITRDSASSLVTVIKRVENNSNRMEDQPSTSGLQNIRSGPSAQQQADSTVSEIQLVESIPDYIPAQISDFAVKKFMQNSNIEELFRNNMLETGRGRLSRMEVYVKNQLLHYHNRSLIAHRDRRSQLIGKLKYRSFKGELETKLLISLPTIADDTQLNLHKELLKKHNINNMYAFVDLSKNNAILDIEKECLTNWKILFPTVWNWKIWALNIASLDKYNKTNSLDYLKKYSNIDQIIAQMPSNSDCDKEQLYRKFMSLERFSLEWKHLKVYATQAERNEAIKSRPINLSDDIHRTPEIIDYEDFLKRSNVKQVVHTNEIINVDNKKTKWMLRKKFYNHYCQYPERRDLGLLDRIKYPIDGYSDSDTSYEGSSSDSDAEEDIQNRRPNNILGIPQTDIRNAISNIGVYTPNSDIAFTDSEETNMEILLEIFENNSNIATQLEKNAKLTYSNSDFEKYMQNMRTHVRNYFINYIIDKSAYPQMIIFTNGWTSERFTEIQSNSKEILLDLVAKKRRLSINTSPSNSLSSNIFTQENTNLYRPSESINTNVTSRKKRQDLIPVSPNIVSPKTATSNSSSYKTAVRGSPLSEDIYSNISISCRPPIRDSEEDIIRRTTVFELCSSNCDSDSNFSQASSTEEEFFNNKPIVTSTQTNNENRPETIIGENVNFVNVENVSQMVKQELILSRDPLQTNDNENNTVKEIKIEEVHSPYMDDVEFIKNSEKLPIELSDTESETDLLNNIQGIERVDSITDDMVRRAIAPSEITPSQVSTSSSTEFATNVSADVINYINDINTRVQPTKYKTTEPKSRNSDFVNKKRRGGPQRKPNSDVVLETNQKDDVNIDAKPTEIESKKRRVNPIQSSKLNSMETDTIAKTPVGTNIPILRPKSTVNYRLLHGPKERPRSQTNANLSYGDNGVVIEDASQ